MSDAWLSLPTMRTLLDQLVHSTTSQYRIDPPRAEELLKQSLATNAPLRVLVENGHTDKQIQRTRIYKHAAADAKRDVYYALRRYHDEDTDANHLVEQLSRTPFGDPRIDGLLEGICNTHASTRERHPHTREFHRRVLEHLQRAESLVDIGCGVYPLQFPFHAAPPSLAKYLALDSDRISMRAVETVAAHQQRLELITLCQDVADGWEAVIQKNGGKPFDVALMFKLIAVIQRRDRQLLSTLAEAPASTWIISGSKQSMTKRRDISRRERAIVRQFVASAERTIAAEFDVGEEFVMVAV